MKGERALAWAAFLTVCIVWGTTYLGIRIAIETIPPLLLTSIRFIAAGVLLLAYALSRGERIPRDARTLGELLLIGVMMVGVGNFAVVWAEKTVPSGMAALLVATSPFWMAILELFRRNGERLTPRAAAGMLIGFVGVALLVMPGGGSGHVDLDFLAGALVIQLGSVGWNFGSIRSKYHLRPMAPLVASALEMLFGGMVVGVVALATGELARLHFTARTFSALAYLTVFGSIVAYSAYMYALAHMPTTTMSVYAYVNPVVAVILGWLILREPLTPMSIVAMVVILAGVALVQTKKRRVVAAPLAEEAAA